MHQGQALLLLLALFFGVAAGLVGCFALMKRMVLASDVLSHLALPGLGIAYLLKINPLIGGAASLLLGTLLVWRLQKGTGLASDAAIGVVFAASLAIGAIVTPKEDLVDALFGELQQVSILGFSVGLAATLLVIFSLFVLKDRLTISIFSPELAASCGVKIDLVDLYFLLIFSVTILVGLRFMGTLLASALIILPASTARHVADRLWSFLLLSSAASLTAVLAGFLLNTFVFKISTVGPTIVIISALLFGLSFLKPA
jgi:ABC-type Mn2+/Zn2+ transport system permease subunit